MNYWLVKSEPSAYSFEQFMKDGQTVWSGVRNYAARIHLNGMKKGDEVFIYHSSCDVPGIYGVGEVICDSLGDPTALNKKDSHYDSKSTKENPIWFAPEIKFIKKFKEPFTLFQIKVDGELKNILYF